MEFLELERGTAVKVHWADSARVTGWQYRNPENADVNHVVTLGLVVITKPSCLVLTSSIDESGGVLDPLAIPWGAITELNVLNRDAYEAAVATA